jgi:hypothetical protein
VASAVVAHDLLRSWEQYWNEPLIHLIAS